MKCCSFYYRARPIFWRIFYVLIIGMILTGCDQQTKEEPTEVIRPIRIFNIEILGASVFRSFPGLVEASNRSELAFRVAGQVIRLPAKSGTRVEKGEVLAQLDSKDFQLVIDDRNASYELTRVQFRRAQELVKKKVLSQIDFDTTRSNYLSAESNLKAAQLNLAYTELRAPFDGVVSRVFVNNYENIQAKQAILNLQSTGELDIVFNVPESIFNNIIVNAPKEFPPIVTFDRQPGSQYEAPVYEVDTEADQKTRTYRVVSRMPAPKGLTILSGMTATVTVDLSKITNLALNRIFIPVGSVFVDDEAPVESAARFVWKVNPEDMTVSRIEIEIGDLSSRGLEVTRGLESGDIIAAAGAHYLSEGQHVKRWEREPGL